MIGEFINLVPAADQVWNRLFALRPQSEKPIPNLIRCWNKVDEFADQVVVVENKDGLLDNETSLKGLLASSGLAMYTDQMSRAGIVSIEDFAKVTEESMISWTLQ